MLFFLFSIEKKSGRFEEKSGKTLLAGRVKRSAPGATGVY
jgi:hypothetical protein